MYDDKKVYNIVMKIIIKGVFLYTMSTAPSVVPSKTTKQITTASFQASHNIIEISVFFIFLWEIPAGVLACYDRTNFLA